jgi:hypothetical protein
MVFIEFIALSEKNTGLSNSTFYEFVKFHKINSINATNAKNATNPINCQTL